MRKILLSAALLVATTMSFAQVGLGTNTPDASAALDLTSTTQGFLPPRLTNAQMNGIPTAVEGLMVYCSDCTQKGVYVYTGSVWEQMAGSSVASIAIAISTSGKGWMDRNLGAPRVAIDSTDAAAYGDLYQWGRNADGHESRTSTVAGGPVASGVEGANFITSTSDWLSTRDDTRWGATKTANDPCPTGFRVPTNTELNAERLLFVTSNGAGAFGSILKLPYPGNRANTTGVLSGVNTVGNYWTSTINGDKGRYLNFTSTTSAMVTSGLRANGYSVRCIKQYSSH